MLSTTNRSLIFPKAVIFLSSGRCWHVRTYRTAQKNDSFQESVVRAGSVKSQIPTQLGLSSQINCVVEIWELTTLLLGGLWLAGILAGLFPAWRGYRNSLADGPPT
ncbi:MAG: hypothetical protein EP300_08645 [Gammaproteobacteria bacterium]|nr:MAG: hypothetical protein EP300_08645 [Gammaproteobacteria bacterium]